MVQRSTTRRGPPPEQGVAEVIFALLAAWRVELCLLAPPVALGVWTYLHFGPVFAGVVVTVLVLLVVVPAPNRHLLIHALHAANVRRRLEVAFRSLPGVLSDRPPFRLTLHPGHVVTLTITGFSLPTSPDTLGWVSARSRTLRSVSGRS